MSTPKCKHAKPRNRNHAVRWGRDSKPPNWSIVPLVESRFNIVTHMFNISHLNFMLKPNPMVYLTNPKTFTLVHIVEIVNIECNHVFKFQFYIHPQQSIGITYLKMIFAWPKACLFVFTIIAYSNYTNISIHIMTPQMPQVGLNVQNMVRSLIIQKVLKFQAQFKRVKSSSGVDPNPKAIQVQVGCEFFKDEFLIACSSHSSKINTTKLNFWIK